MDIKYRFLQKSINSKTISSILYFEELLAREAALKIYWVLKMDLWGLLVSSCYGYMYYQLKINMDQENPQLLSLANIVVLGRIGRGSTSHVFRVQSTLNKKLYAMKVFDKKGKKYSCSALNKQLKIQEGLQHPNILQLINHIEDSDNHYVLTDYCEGGELTKRLKGTLAEAQLAGIAYQIAQGLEYLHRQGIAHCDLKLSNILLHHSAVKIGDFGYSRRIDGGSCSKLCGTVFYLSPEIVKDKRRLLYKEADVWALGICLLILITKKEPYSAEHFKDITAQILKAERTPLPHVSPELDDLMQRLLDVDPSTRITLDQLFNHPFFLKHKSFISLPTDKERTGIKIEKQIEKVSSKDMEQSEIQEHNEPKWSFKRVPKADRDDGNLTQKKRGALAISNDATVKQTRRSRQELIGQAEGENDQTLKKQELSRIQTRLICPLSEFYYSTRNDGFVKINREGDLSIKVKETVFSIINHGRTFCLGQDCYSLQQINQFRTRKDCNNPYELYSYALSIVNIFKYKRYLFEAQLKFNGHDLVLALDKFRTKWVALTTFQRQPIVFEIEKGSRTRYRVQGQEWSNYLPEERPEMQALLRFISENIANHQQFL